MNLFRTVPLRLVLALAVVCLIAAPGCKPKPQGTTGTEMTPPPTLGPSPVPTPEETGAALDIKRVRIDPDGSAHPDTVKLKKKAQIVVWALQGEGELHVTFADSPFGDPPQQPVCVGRFCAVLYPPREGSENPPAPGHEGRLYEYTVHVTAAGAATKTDPNVEVIP